MLDVKGKHLQRQYHITVCVFECSQPISSSLFSVEYSFCFYSDTISVVFICLPFAILQFMLNISRSCAQWVLLFVCVFWSLCILTERKLAHTHIMHRFGCYWKLSFIVLFVHCFYLNAIRFYSLQLCFTKWSLICIPHSNAVIFTWHDTSEPATPPDIRLHFSVLMIIDIKLMMFACVVGRWWIVLSR